MEGEERVSAAGSGRALEQSRSRHPTDCDCGAARPGDWGAGPGAGLGVWPAAPSPSPTARLYLLARSCSSVFLRSCSGCALPSRQVGHDQEGPAPHMRFRQARQKLWPQGNVTGQESSPWQMMQPRSSSASHTGTVRPLSRPAMVTRLPPGSRATPGTARPQLRLLRLLPSSSSALLSLPLCLLLAVPASFLSPVLQKADLQVPPPSARRPLYRGGATAAPLRWEIN